MSLLQFVETAKAQKGKPYVSGAAGPDSFDAAGLINYCYQVAEGKTLGTLSRIAAAGAVVIGTVQPGDVVLFDTKGKGKIDHAAIVISDTRMMHALNPDEGVTTRKLSDAWFQARVVRKVRLPFTVPVISHDPVPDPVITPPDPTPLTTGFAWPGGTIKTKRTNGQPYGIPWTQVSRWYELLVQAAHEAGINWRDLAAMAVIESDAQHYRTGKTSGTRAEVLIRASDGYDDVPAVGMMQVKLQYHAWRVPDADGYTPLGNLRLAAAIIAAGIRQYGNVEKAITNLYFPGDDSNGTTQGSYLRIFRELKAELDANGATPVVQPDPYAVIFGGVPVRVEYGWLSNAGLPYYDYGVGHGTTAATQHTGDDVLVPYGTKLYAPGPGVVDCVGTGGSPRWGQGCGAYTDTGDAGPGGKLLGIGNITLMLDSGHKLTLGHCRTASVKPGQRVSAGQLLGTSGGQNGPHTHVEVSVLKDKSYWLVAPKPALIQSMSGAPADTRPMVQFAGAKVAVPFDVPFRIALLPTSQKNQRPGTKMVPDRYIQHETGNPNPGANAEMHMRYLQNGAPDNAGRSQQLSYHFTVDGDEVIQLLPLDEVAWHGGDGTGPCNYRGISCELCIEDNNRNKVKARANAEKLAAAVMTAMGITILEQHHACSGKDCPAFMRKEGYWSTFTSNVSRLRSGTTINQPPTTYANPIMPPAFDGTDKVLNGITFWALNRIYTTREETKVYQYADETSSQVRTPLAPGESVEGWYLVESKGELWIVTKWGSRINMKHLSPRFSLPT